MSNTTKNDKHQTQRTQYPPFELPKGEYMFRVVPTPAIGHVKGKNSRKLQKMEEDTHTEIKLLSRFDQKNFFRKELFIEMNTAEVGVFQVVALAPVGTEGEDDYKVSDINLACKMIAGEVKRWREPPPAPHAKRDKASDGHKHSNDGEKA